MTYSKYRQSRVLNVLDNLVNVVVGAVLDASVCVIVLFRKFGRNFQSKFISPRPFFNMNK